MTALASFFATMGPFLRGETTTESVTADLGPSRSGREAMGFYRELIARNVLKAMRDLYPSLPALTQRAPVGPWADLVAAYARVHHPRGHHPDDIGTAFPEWLQRRRLAEPEQPAWLEECADFHRCQVRAATAPDPDAVTDGLDVTLFVRAYVHRVPALIADPRHADLSPGTTPTLVLIYRSWSTAAVHSFRADGTHMLALARRQPGQDSTSSALQSTVSPDRIDRAEQQLIDRGVVRPGVLSSTEPQRYALRQ